MHLFISIYRIIPKDWRGRFYLLVLLYIVLGIFEMLGVASIMPFIALLSDPSAVANSSVGNFFTLFVGLKIDELPVHLVGLVVVVLFIIGNILSLASIWLSIRFAAALSVRLAGTIAVSFFEQGIYFLQSNSSAVLANYTVREVDRVASGGVLQLCLIISKLFQVILVVTMLAFVSPSFALIFGVSALFLYLLFFQIFRKKIIFSGEDLLRSSGDSIRLANELFSSSREVLVRGNVNFYIQKMLILLRKVHKGDEVIRVYPMMPKYLIEVFAFTILFSLPIYKSWVGDDYRSLVPFIALFAYAGYRLLPSLQQIYSSLSALRSNSAAVDFVSGYLEPHKKTSFPIYRVDKFPSSIELVHVSSSCEADRAPVLSNISLSIFKGEKVAIVGLSGSGKSSLLDIFLGLSSPSKGKLLLDGVDVGNKRLCWSQELLGYCPQSPLILDDTVAANIAFGLNENQIDQSRCYQVAELALISEMIANLSEGLLTQLGSGGVVLSGGENQRISIARALYHDPKIIILDEPSSALDPLHAKQLFQNLCSKSSKETVVVVTHDWDLLELFDKVIVLDSGKLIGLGSYSEVAFLVTNLRARGDQ